MENNQNTISTTTRNWWKIATISLIVLAVVLIGTTTLFAVQSSQKQIELNELKIQKSRGKNNSNTETFSANENDKDENDESSQASFVSFTISEWGIKFELPEGLDAKNVKYGIPGDRTIVFSTDRVQGLEGNCKPDAVDAPFGWLVRLLRVSQEDKGKSLGDDRFVKISDNIVDTLGGSTYYYIVENEPCSSDITVKTDTDLLIKMLSTVR